MLKKILGSLLVAVLLVGGLIGCSNTNNKQNQENKVEDKKEEKEIVKEDTIEVSDEEYKESAKEATEEIVTEKSKERKIYNPVFIYEIIEEEYDFNPIPTSVEGCRRYRVVGRIEYGEDEFKYFEQIVDISKDNKYYYKIATCIRDEVIDERQEIVNVPQPQVVEFSNGNYVCGRDFVKGIYNIEALSGDGNVICISAGLNEIMGVGDNEFLQDIESKTFNNATFTNGDILEISNGVTVRLTPIQ